MQSSGELALWLAENAALPIAELHDRYCRLLVAGGLPIWRSSLGIETLHPEDAGGQLVWLAEEAPKAMVFYHGVENTSSYLDSPLRIVDETRKPFRTRLDGPPAGMQLLRELQDLAKSLDQPVLMSGEFAGVIPRGLIDLGKHPLRGIGDAERIFALPAA